MADSVRVPGFLPSTSGLHFVNYYNYSDNDAVELHASIAGDRTPVQLGSTPTPSVYCFFHTPYSYAPPPTL